MYDVYMKMETDSKGRFLPVHGMRYTAFYNVWRSMLKRCRNKTHKSYKDYGGRGIKCLWNSFEDFRDDMYESYLLHKAKNSDTSLERIENEGNYYKENCRWATQKEQSQNRRSNTFMEINGEKKTLSQWASEYGLLPDTLIWRFYKYGASEKILLPARKYNRK